MSLKIRSLEEGIHQLSHFHTKRLWNGCMVNLERKIDFERLQQSCTNDGITIAERSRLVQIFNKYAQLVSKPFGRNFRCSESALINVDLFGRPDQELLKDPLHLSEINEFTGAKWRDGSYENSCLMHVRSEAEQICLTGGGFVDCHETSLEAMSRELEEETSGSKLKNALLFEIYDAPRGDPEHRVSLVFTGVVSGIPKTNPEARAHYLVRENDMQDIPKEKFFSQHNKLLERYYGINDQTERGIPYVGKQMNFDRSGIVTPLQFVDRSYIRRSISIVENEYTALSDAFLNFAQKMNNPDFTKSRLATGHGWANTSETNVDLSDSWNDDFQLGKYIKDFHLAATRISKLFNIRVTTGECGVLNCAAIILFDRKIVVLKSDLDGKLYLPTGEHRNGELFRQTLFRMTYQHFGIRVEDQKKANLMAFCEEPSHKNPDGNRLRTFLMETRTRSLPNLPLKLMTLDEIRESPASAWKPMHASFIRTYLNSTLQK